MAWLPALAMAQSPDAGPPSQEPSEAPEDAPDAADADEGTPEGDAPAPEEPDEDEGDTDESDTDESDTDESDTDESEGGGAASGSDTEGEERDPLAPDANAIDSILAGGTDGLEDEPEEEAAEVEDEGDGDEGDRGEISDLDLDALLSGEYVNAVSRTSEAVSDVPAVVTVITRQQIERWGYRSLAEVLEQIPGFYLIDDHVTPNVAVRGVSGGLRAQSGLIQLTIDGQPLVYRPTAARWLGPEAIPVTAIERIEIIRGPGSTVYGADAFLGVINIVTRDPENLPSLDMIMAGNYAGGFGGDLDMTIARRIDDVRFLISWRVFREDRSGLRLPSSSPASRVPAYRRSLDDAHRDRARDLTLTSVVGFSRVTYRPDRTTTIALTGHVSILDRGAEFADWTQLASGLDLEGRARGNVISLWQGYTTLSLTSQPEEHVALELNVRAFGGSPTDRDDVDLGNDIYHVRRDNDFRGGDFTGNVRWSPLDELRFTLGVDGVIDEQRLPGVLHVLYAATPDAPPGSVRESTSTRQDRRLFLNIGAYLLGNLRIEQALQIEGGIRYDYNNIYGSQVNGRLGARLTLFETLNLKVTYGSAFRAPTALLLYGVPLTSGDILGNPDLRPQQNHSFEGQIRWRPWSWLNLQTGFAYSYLLNKAEFARVGANLVARNVAEVGSWSWDTVLSADWSEQLRAYASFSYVEGVRNLGVEGYRASLLGRDLPAYPPFILRVGAHYTIPGFPLRFGTQLRWLSERRASDNNVLELGEVYTLPDGWYWDATLAFHDLDVFPTGSTTISFTARNILGTAAAHPGFSGIDYPSAPRTFILSLRQQL